MQKKGIEQERLYYIARDYMIPQFLDEYPFLKKELNPIKAFRIGESENVYTIATYIPMPDAQWKEIYRDFNEMPKLIDLYLSHKMFERPDVEKALERVQARLINTRPNWRAINALHQGWREEAFALLKADLRTSHDNRSDCVPTAYRLIADYVEAGEKNLALEVLDFLTTSTDDGLIHRDSLKVRYSAIDPQSGIQRYEEKVRFRPTFTLSVSDSTPQLVGQFIDAASGNSVCLDSLRGKLVIVDVWTTWCAGCRLEMPDLNTFAESIKGMSDVSFLSVNGDGPMGGKSPTEVVEFARRFPLRFPVLLDRPDSSLIQRWGVFDFPTKLLFDERGRMLRRPKDHFTLEEARAFLDNRVSKQKKF
jgi:thiol-disulfide isomerase/thioredoxin